MQESVSPGMAVKQLRINCSALPSASSGWIEIGDSKDADSDDRLISVSLPWTLTDDGCLFVRLRAIFESGINSML
jgi:hypothetical protein